MFTDFFLHACCVRRNIGASIRFVKRKFSLDAENCRADIRGMTLTDYLALTGMTRREFAALLGVSNSTVTRLVYGETVPSRELLARIATVTDRRVLPADIYADV